MATFDINRADTLDILTSRLKQIDGILAMVATAGANGKDFDTQTHTSIMASLWAAQTLVQQAQESASAL